MMYKITKQNGEISTVILNDQNAKIEDEVKKFPDYDDIVSIEESDEIQTTPLNYYDLRAAQYRNGDYIDALMKEMNYRRTQGEDLTQPMDDALAHWLKVKQDFPKE